MSCRFCVCMRARACVCTCLCVYLLCMDQVVVNHTHTRTHEHALSTTTLPCSANPFVHHHGGLIDGAAETANVKVCGPWTASSA